MSKQKIQTRYKRIRSREQDSLVQALMNDQTNICKDFMINLNTDTNLTIHTLKKKFRLLNAIVNRKLFKNYQSVLIKELVLSVSLKRLNNNHINLLLKMPKEYDVLKVLVLINQGWKKLGFRPHFEVSKNKRAVSVTKLNNSLIKEVRTFYMNNDDKIKTNKELAKEIVDAWNEKMDDETQEEFEERTKETSTQE